MCTRDRSIGRQALRNSSWSSTMYDRCLRPLPCSGMQRHVVLLLASSTCALWTRANRPQPD
eukprot:7822341-Alexandrium_andersonii.AAC.1